MSVPVITFTVDNSEINQGDSAVLSWSVEGAISAVLDGNTGVEPIGSLEVTPTTTSCYTLTAQNEDGQSVAFVIVSVTIPQVSIPVFSTG